MSTSEKSKKILFISDVHAKIKEMNDFFHYILETKKEKIAYAVHLGDFWSGRNYNGTEQVYDEWEDLEYFDKLPFSLFLLKGNEDLKAPDFWWLSSNLWLMKDQEPFYLEHFKALSIDYHYSGMDDDQIPTHPEYSEDDGFELIFSHRPPLGILDHTYHYASHKKLTDTGSPLVRHYVDNLAPRITFFGHFHYSNFTQIDSGLVVCIDKLIRITRKGDIPFRYSYALLDPEHQILEVYWKSRLFFKYSMTTQEITYLNRFDKRNLYQEKKS